MAAPVPGIWNLSKTFPHSEDSGAARNPLVAISNRKAVSRTPEGFRARRSLDSMMDWHETDLFAQEQAFRREKQAVRSGKGLKTARGPRRGAQESWPRPTRRGWAI